MNALGTLPADAFDLGQALDRGVHQLVDVGEFRRQQLGNMLTHMTNAKAGQHAGQAAFLAGGDAVQQVFGGLFSHALQIDKLVECQTVDVRDRAHQPRIDKLLDKSGAKSFDVHGVAVREKA